MTRILAIDLGKFKSVTCLLDTTTNETEFWTMSTDQQIVAVARKLLVRCWVMLLRKDCGISGERPTTRAKFSAFYVSLRVARACGEMFPIAPDSRPSRRERSRRSTKPSRAASRRLDPQTLRESSSYALLVNGFCLRMGHLVGISAYRGRRFHSIQPICPHLDLFANRLPRIT